MEQTYDWLYKDAPYSSEWPRIYIAKRQNSNCMYIALHPNWCSGHSNPVALLWHFAGQIDFSRPFNLVADFGYPRRAGWPLDLGFRRLGEYLAVLAYEEIGLEFWTKLTIVLPTIELPYEANSPSLLPLDGSKNLHCLIWTGHRRRLRIVAAARIYLPPFLTMLHLTCDLSVAICGA
ncbi:hypothetical protein H2248_010987 [Termitomyces sp. 'cryptogamus']|nr:hypothetical protein H2248_010987 [Termitomyces sp. 'cryptogamus']